MNDDPIAVVGHDAVTVAQIVAGQAGPAVETEQDLVAFAEAVDLDFVTVVDLDAILRIRLALRRRLGRPFRHALPLFEITPDAIVARVPACNEHDSARTGLSMAAAAPMLVWIL